MLSSFLLLREIFPVEIKMPTYNSRRSPHVLGTGKAYIRVEFNVLLQRSLAILLGVIRPSPAIKCPVPITSQDSTNALHHPFRILENILNFHK